MLIVIIGNCEQINLLFKNHLNNMLKIRILNVLFL